MANERLYLGCTICINDPDVASEDCVFYFAKYYPTTGWYTTAKVNFQEDLDDWFDHHKHGDLFGQFVTMFGSQIDSRQQSKNDLLRAMHQHVGAAVSMGKKSES